MTRIAFLAAALTLAASAEPGSWSAPFPAHTISGNVHYIGTADLACYLITTPAGNILVNSGLADSAPLMKASAAKLGFSLKDVKYMLTMQAHYDHVAAFAELQKLSGAKVFATEKDAPILESGGKSEPYIGRKNPFAPVKVDRRLKDGDTVSLGGTTVRLILTPGHTPGSASYVITTPGKPDVYLVNLLSVVTPLVGNTHQPDIVQDFRRGFATQKSLKPVIWAAGHASQYDMEAKYKKGSFADPEGYARAVARYEKLFEEQLAKEKSR